MAEDDPLDEAHGHVAGVATSMIRGAEALTRTAQQRRMSHAQVVNQLNDQQRERYETVRSQRAAWLQERTERLDDWWDNASSFTRAEVYEAAQRSEVAEPEYLGPQARSLSTKIEQRAGLEVDAERDLSDDAIDQRRDRLEATTSQSIGAEEDVRRTRPLLDTEEMRPRLDQAWSSDPHRTLDGPDRLSVYRAWLSDRSGIHLDTPDVQVSEAEHDAGYFRRAGQEEQTEEREATQEATTVDSPAQEQAAESDAEQAQNMADLDSDRADRSDATADLAWDSQERRDTVDADLAESGVGQAARLADRQGQKTEGRPPHEAVQPSRRTGARKWRNPSAGAQRDQGRTRGPGR